MKQIYELPPMLSGTAEQQIRAMHAYILRLVLQMNEEAEA